MFVKIIIILAVDNYNFAFYLPGIINTGTQPIYKNMHLKPVWRIIDTFGPGARAVDSRMNADGGSDDTCNSHHAHTRLNAVISSPELAR